MENAGCVYRMQMKPVEIRGPGEDPGGDEEEYTKGERKGGGGFGILDPMLIHFFCLAQLLGGEITWGISLQRFGCWKGAASKRALGSFLLSHDHSHLRYVHKQTQ